MNLDYITINGLDANIKKRIEDDLAKSGYTGSKSAYVTALMNDGLDKREAIRGVTSEKDFQSLYAKASAIEEQLEGMSQRAVRGRGRRGGLQDPADRDVPALGALGQLEGHRPFRHRRGAEGRPSEEPLIP